MIQEDSLDRKAGFLGTRQSKFRQRLARHRRVQQEAFADATEIGRFLFKGDEQGYQDYLIENGASWEEAVSIVKNPYHGQQLRGGTQQKSGFRR